MPDDFPRDGLESLLDQSERQRVFDRRVDIDSWAGGLSQEQKARVPVIRIGRRWINSLWLLPVGAAGLRIAVALAQQSRQYGWMQDFRPPRAGTGRIQRGSRVLRVPDADLKRVETHGRHGTFVEYSQASHSGRSDSLA
jgi:hypothetical protein